MAVRISPVSFISPLAELVKPKIKNKINAMIIDGTVVNVMYLIWVNKSVPAIAGAKLVVSDNGDILSPK